MPIVDKFMHFFSFVENICFGAEIQNYQVVLLWTAIHVLVSNRLIQLSVT